MKRMSQSGDKSVSSICGAGAGASSNHSQRPLAVLGRGMPTWSKAVESAALEAAGGSTSGCSWAPGGSASFRVCRAAERHQSRSEKAQEPRAEAPLRWAL